MRKATHTSREPLVQPVQPELVLTRRSDGPDPRLIELVRLLARRAAREYYYRLVAERPLKRP